METQATLSQESVDAIGHRLRSLEELAQSPHTEMEQMLALIREIPGMSNALVQRANSPEFALRNQISRVEHAIAILGSRRTVDTIRLQGVSPGVPAPHFRKQQRET